MNFMWIFCGTWNLWVWNVYVEPREPESLCGTVVEPGTFMEPQKWGTLFAWKLCGPRSLWTLGEPELLRLEPLCGTLGTCFQVSGSCPKPPQNFIGRTPSFSSRWGSLGKNEPSFFKGHRPSWNLHNLWFFSFRLPQQVRWNLVEPQLARVEPFCGTLGNIIHF